MLIAAVMTAIGLAASSDAITARPPSRLQALVQSSGYQDNIQRLFAKLPTDVFQRCQTLISNGSTISVLTPVRFAPDGYPVAGSWKQSFPIRGCGNDTTINIVFQGQPGEKITSIVAVSGDTHADLALQRDALHYAWLGAKVAAPDCMTPHVQHTRYDGIVGAAQGTWRETWVLAVCGRTIELPITFTPDPTGTRITAGLPKSLR